MHLSEVAPLYYSNTKWSQRHVGESGQYDLETFKRFSIFAVVIRYLMLDPDKGLQSPCSPQQRDIIVLHAVILERASEHCWKTWSFECLELFWMVTLLCRRIQDAAMTRRPLQEDVIWNYFIQILLGVQVLHEKKILHRDIKPMNIFLGKGDVVKVGDLGIAKILNHEAVAHTMIGTPHYMCVRANILHIQHRTVDTWRSRHDQCFYFQN